MNKFCANLTFVMLMDFWYKIDAFQEYKNVSDKILLLHGSVDR